MIDRILEFSLRQRYFVLLGMVGLIGAGIWAAIHLPVDAVPDITNTQVQINTEVTRLAPEEIENLVTFPIETEMAGIPGLVELRSLTKFGLSQVTLVFRDGIDPYRARQWVGERLQNVKENLPDGVLPRLAPVSTGLGEIFYYILDYEEDAEKPADREVQLRELWAIQEWIVKPGLRNIPGVAEVNTAGGYEKQIVILPRTEALIAAGLSLEDLAEAVSANVENAGGGLLFQAGEQVIVRSVGRVTSPEEIRQLPVKFRGGTDPLKVGDLAEVALGSRLRTGAATENGKEALLGTVMMLVGENSRVVARRVGAGLPAIQERLPEGVVIRPVYDRADLVDRTIATVKRNLFEGAILVAVVLLALLGNARGAFIVAMAIPLSFFFALIGMVQWNISGNLMSLGAVDFGLIIDGAVVMVENIVRRLGERQHGLGRNLTIVERFHTVLTASRQVARPMVFGVLIITVVYIPILALTGIEGKMFRPMALTVMLALGGALALSLTLMPVLCSFLLRGRVAEGENALVRLALWGYRPLLRLGLRWPMIPVAAGVGAMVWALLWFPRLGAEFVPQLDEGSYTVMVYKTASTSLGTSLAMQLATEQHLLENVPEVTRVFSRIGTSDVATDPMPPSENDLYIFYKPREEWRQVEGRPISKDALAEIMNAEIERAVPGQALLFAQPIEMRFNELLEGIRSDLAVKIFGPDYDTLEDLAARVKSVLEGIPGATDVEFESMGRNPVLEFRLRRDVLARHNLQAREVNETIASALAGREAGTVVEGNRRFDIVLRLGEDRRSDLESIRRLPVKTPAGGLVLLGDLVDIRLNDQVDRLIRESGRRRTAIMVNLGDRDVESFVMEASAKVRNAVPLPEGYTLEFGGQFENLQEARQRLAVVVPSALALIFILVFTALGSLRQTVLVYTGIPLALTGGVFALGLRGLPFSISAAVGFIALSGVAVLNGLVLINTFNQLREEGSPIRDSVLEGSLTRLRPVLMTALVASFGFVPMALATGPGAEVQRPLATVVIGGILTSTFLTLLLLPALYDRGEQWGTRKQEEEQEAENAKYQPAG